MAGRGRSIRDVAQHAGVSVSTVSKVFNNTGRLSPTTRQRVLAAAADLHFKPNALIRSLQRGESLAIGVYTWNVHEDPSRDITMQLARGIGQGINTACYDMVTYSQLPGRTPASIASTFLDGRIDGVIVGPTEVDTVGLTALAGASLPIVVVYRREVPDGVGYVAVDNIHGVSAAMAHLLALGHRRIAFYAPFFTYDYAERAKGYRQTLEGAGIGSDPELVHLPNPGEAYEPLALTCDRLLALVEPPTAVVVGDDNESLLWMDELRRRGLTIPDDISVVGFDDVAAATAASLTTIRQPAVEVGRIAAQFVKAMIDGASAEECRIVLPVEVVHRTTTAAPRVKPSRGAAGIAGAVLGE